MTNKQELVRPELVHTHAGLELTKFLALVDETGGWPLGYKYVSFFHDGPCGNRYCMFTNNYLRTGWWATICSADDYYWWKLSDERKAEELKAARKQLIAQLR